MESLRFLAYPLFIKNFSCKPARNDKVRGLLSALDFELPNEISYRGVCGLLSTLDFELPNEISYRGVCGLLSALDFEVLKEISHRGVCHAGERGTSVIVICFGFRDAKKNL